jgi:hypothetical protein
MRTANAAASAGKRAHTGLVTSAVMHNATAKIVTEMPGACRKNRKSATP